MCCYSSLHQSHFYHFYLTSSISSPSLHSPFPGSCRDTALPWIPAPSVGFVGCLLILGVTLMFSLSHTTEPPHNHGFWGGAEVYWGFFPAWGWIQIPAGSRGSVARPESREGFWGWGGLSCSDFGVKPSLWVLWGPACS